MHMRFVEAHDRAGRVAKLRKAAGRNAMAATMAYNSETPDNISHFIKHAAKAQHITAVADRFAPSPSDTSRRARLARVAQTARKGFTKARSGGKGAHKAYDHAAKALALYQRKRYQPTVTATKTMHPDSPIKYDRSTAYVKPEHPYMSSKEVSRRRPPLHVQKAGTPKIHLDRTRHIASDPFAGVAHFMKKRLAKKVDDKLPSSTSKEVKDHTAKQLMRANGFDPDYADRVKRNIDKHNKKNTTLPKHATYDYQAHRISKPTIRRVKAHQNLGASGHHPLNFTVKRDLGRREKRVTSQFVRRSHF